MSDEFVMSDEDEDGDVDIDGALDVGLLEDEDEEERQAMEEMGEDMVDDSSEGKEFPGFHVNYLRFWKTRNFVNFFL